MLKLAGKNVMVTGGAGFIGSHLVDRIAKENPGKIVVVDNLFLGKEENLDQTKISFYNIDAAHYENMMHILVDEKIDVVFNLAVIPLPFSLMDPQETVNVNVSIVTTLCELLRNKYYKTLIHFSSSESYGSARIIPMREDHQINPETPYAASKVAGDYIVLSYINTFGVDASIIRPFNNYGPRQNKYAYAGIIPIVINQVILKHPVTIFGDGEQTRDFIYVGDTVDAAVKIYEYENTRGLILNIASGVETSINVLVKKLLTLMNSKVKIVYAKPRPGDVRRHCGDITLAYTLLGFQPDILSDENLLETIKYYLEKEKQE